MLIEFPCSLLSDYDPATGRSGICGHRIMVSDDQVGEMVTCEKCQGQIEVPLEALSPGFASGQKKIRKAKPAVAATKKKKANGAKKAPKRSRKVNELQLEAPASRNSGDVMTFEFENEKINSLYEAVEKKCPKCGAAIEAGKCTKCRYVMPVYKSSFLPLEQLELERAGFQKWFCDIFNEGVSVRMLEIGLHCMLGVLAFIVTLSFALLGGGYRVFGIAFVIAAGLLYVGFIYKGHQIAKNPKAKLAWFQKPFWNALLHVCRKLGWTKYDSRLKNRLIIDLRNAPIVDQKVPHLEGLTKCSVLDLEGTMITDDALKHLYGLKHLHCLIVRRTSVTHEGVIRLQQSNPRMWVWY